MTCGIDDKEVLVGNGLKDTLEKDRHVPDVPVLRVLQVDDNDAICMIQYRQFH